MSIKIEVSYGELIDKITILEIKLAAIKDQKQLDNVRHELGVLEAAWQHSNVDAARLGDTRGRLKATNESLWEIEDQIRIKEASRDFDEEFIALARSVYHVNDERARLKRKINHVLGSTLIEEKSYQPY